MGVVGRLDQYASMLAAEFDDYSMSENLLTNTTSAGAWDSGTFTTETTYPILGLNTVRITDLTSDGDSPNLSGGAISPGTYTVSHYINTINSTSTSVILYIFTFHALNGGFTVSNANATFTLSSKTFGSIAYSGPAWSNASVSAIDCGNGIYRISITATTSLSSAAPGIRAYVTPFPQDTSYLIVAGSQYETGSVATDYTPTSGTAISRVLASTTNTNITGLGTYYSSGFDENVGFATFLSANVFAPYNPVYDEFSGTSFGAGQGRYMRQNTDKSVIVYNEIDEVTDFRDIVRNGLVLDLDAAQPLSYGGTGTTWVDLSGNGNNGTLVNTPTYNTGNNGYFDFDHNQFENVTFSSASTLQFLNRLPYTLEAWVYPTRNPGANNWTGIFDREDASIGSRDGYNLYFLGSATTDTFFTTERFVAGTNNPTFVTLNQSVSVNAWQHIVATYDGTTLTLYRNGSSVGTPATSTGNITNTSKTLTIGVRGGNHFGGRIANAKIYSTSLTSTQILQNYNALRHRFGL